MESEIAVSDVVEHDGELCVVFLIMGANAVLTSSDGHTQYLVPVADLKKETNNGR